MVSDFLALDSGHNTDQTATDRIGIRVGTGAAIL
jgi:hypothetical protein